MKSFELDDKQPENICTVQTFPCNFVDLLPEPLPSTPASVVKAMDLIVDKQHHSTENRR